MRRNRQAVRLLLLPVLLPVLGLLGGQSSAAAQSTGFALDRFEPSERGSDWFANESLDLRGSARPALGIVGDYAWKPLVFYDASGNEQAVIVRHQLFAHLGGGLVLFDRLRLAASVPILAYDKGQSFIVGSTLLSNSNKAAFGDLRFGADLRLLGSYGDAFTLALGAQLWLPTGSQAAFASDGKLRVRPRMMAAGDVGPIAYAAQVGFNYRGRKDDVAGTPYGNELGFSAALGVRALDKTLLIGPELFGSTLVSDGNAFKKRGTPLELIFTAKYHVTRDLRIGAGAGPGLSRGLGEPAVRLLASLEWFPDVEKPVERPTDRDGDGVLDVNDACPDVPGVRTASRKTNGCPAPRPRDRDHDGIIDDNDACPDEAGVKSDDASKNGCPPPKDRDGDGILDDKDACPTEPGVANDDPKKNGCPAPKDSDDDGILDPEDACPNEAGPRDDDPKKNGCPKAAISGGQIRILEQVQFATASDKILPESDPVLQAVLAILQDHSEITHLSIEGHTDDRGGSGYNRGLSKRRAASVVKWLTGHGVDKGRLKSAGFGPDRPIESNSTDEGRQRNRRVEFHIVDAQGRSTTEVRDQ